MRSKIEKSVDQSQTKFGQIDIANIQIDFESRDQIPQILLGLQYLYKEKEYLFQALELLDQDIHLHRSVRSDLGREGMSLWQILVCGVLRVNNNWDYDHLENMVSSHREIRQMLGFGFWDDDQWLARRRLIANLSLVSNETYDKISSLIARAGHRFLGVEEEELNTRVDSFVLESHIHHPTDSNLLMDSIRKMIMVIILLEGLLGHPIIGQSKKELKAVKALFNKIRKMRKSNAKKEATRKRREQEIIEAHQAFLGKIMDLMTRVRRVFDKLPEELLKDDLIAMEISQLSGYMDCVDYQIDLVDRRVLKGETIPQHDKIYSIFEYYAQWISKGKAKAPVELGLRVAVMDDQFGFILHSEVMYKSVEEIMESVRAEELTRDQVTKDQITDEKIAVPFAKEALNKFPNISKISFDKGFHTIDNQKELPKLIPNVALPKKGKLSNEEKERQATDIFIQSRKRHSGIESAIHALENHGLDICPDRGLSAFRRYVAGAVLARNLQVLGSHIRKRYLEEVKVKKAA